MCVPAVTLGALQYRIYAAFVSQILFAPYFVFLCFALLVLLNPLYRRRLAECIMGRVP